jgi:hypothetical protein
MSGDQDHKFHEHGLYGLGAKSVQGFLAGVIEIGCVGIITAQREAADEIGLTIIQLSAAVRKRIGSSSPLRAAVIIRLATSSRTI